VHLQAMASELIAFPRARQLGVWRRAQLPILSSVMSASEDKRKALEKAAAKHHRVVEVDKVTFTYRPTAPSGPVPTRAQLARHRRGRY
jgi:hypothetical protein